MGIQVINLARYQYFTCNILLDVTNRRVSLFLLSFLQLHVVCSFQMCTSRGVIPICVFISMCLKLNVTKMHTERTEIGAKLKYLVEGTASGPKG